MTPLTGIIENLWSDRYLVYLERVIWLSVMEYHSRFSNRTGVHPEHVDGSRQVLNDISMESIRRRELVTKHDLKARLEEFAALSGHQRIHLAMTSADIVENTYIIRIWRSVEALGLEDRVSLPPFRGIRGPVGSDQDQMDLLGDPDLVVGLSDFVARKFGIPKVIGAVGQCMPRSFDFRVGAGVRQYLPDDSVWTKLVDGCVAMLAGQELWLEGDVATSVVRRYAIPVMFWCAAAALEEEAGR
jgi:adenylosuccinate lyase